MMSPFSGTRKKDRRGRRGLNMDIENHRGKIDCVTVDVVKTMLAGSKIVHVDFDDDRMVIYVETLEGELYNIYSGTDEGYEEDGWGGEWICKLFHGDRKWQEDQREYIRESNEYLEQRRKRYPND